MGPGVTRHGVLAPEELSVLSVVVSCFSDRLALRLGDAFLGLSASDEDSILIVNSSLLSPLGEPIGKMWRCKSNTQWNRGADGIDGSLSISRAFSHAADPRNIDVFDICSSFWQICSQESKFYI